jgi:hypothetical protein
MSCSMSRLDNPPVSVSGTKPLPLPLPKLPPGEKHLDATLLATVQRRKLELGVLPGVPLN